MCLDITDEARDSVHRKRLQSQGDDARGDEADSIGKGITMAAMKSSNRLSRRRLLGTGIGGAGLLVTGCSVFVGAGSLVFGFRAGWFEEHAVLERLHSSGFTTAERDLVTAGNQQQSAGGAA